MAVYLDFSDIATRLLECSKFLIADGTYVIFNDENQEFTMNSNWKENAFKEIKTSKFPFLLFWIRFSTGIEYLAKAVLIKHEIDIFSKKNGTEFEKGTKIEANNNSWLQNILQAKGIEYVKQLHTGTLGLLYSSKFKELLNKGIINNKECSDIEFALKHLADMRRNNNVHFFFKENVLIEYNDLPGIYIPIANKFLEIFFR